MNVNEIDKICKIDGKIDGKINRICKIDTILVENRLVKSNPAFLLPTCQE